MMIFTRRQIETTLAAILAAITAVIGISSRGEEVPGPKFLRLERIGRFEQPVYLTQPPAAGSALYVVEKVGTVRIHAGGAVRAQPFLDLRREVKHTGKGGEQGLLSMAFAPDYEDTGLLYVAYTDRRDALRIVEYRRHPADELRADPRSARLVLRIPQPTTKHHGGLVLFGPGGHLYIGSGDGGPSGDPTDVAQDKRSLRGKILRIDPQPGPAPSGGKAKGKGKKSKGKGGKKGKPPKAAPYTVPADNPFVERPGRDEIFAYGLRNPWRFSFDPAAGSIAIGDVGDDRFEEIDYLPVRKALGANFGWSAYEGNAQLKGNVKRGRTVAPVLAYAHGPSCAVTGGFVVRDPRLARIAGRELVGRYLYGDYCAGKLYAFRPRPGGPAGKRRSFRFKVPYLSSFGEDNAGRIYVLSQFGVSRDGKKLTRGSVYRLDPRRKDG
jgi:glucose/arabinose dehydrogenase